MPDTGQKRITLRGGREQAVPSTNYIRSKESRDPRRRRHTSPAPRTSRAQVEVLTLAGNIGVKRASDPPPRDEPALHAHVVIGRADGTACGGHLLDARVRPTLEVIVIETPQHLRRRLHPETGLALIDLSG